MQSQSIAPGEEQSKPGESAGDNCIEPLSYSLIGFLCGPLCISAFSVLKGIFNTETTEIHRGPQSYDVAGANQPRILRATCLKNRIILLKTRKLITKPTPTMRKSNTGKRTEQITETTARISSTTLAT